MRKWLVALILFTLTMAAGWIDGFAAGVRREQQRAMPVRIIPQPCLADPQPVSGKDLPL